MRIVTVIMFVAAVLCAIIVTLAYLVCLAFKPARENRELAIAKLEGFLWPVVCSISPP